MVIHKFFKDFPLEQTYVFGVYCRKVFLFFGFLPVRKYMKKKKVRKPLDPKIAETIALDIKCFRVKYA